VAGFGENDCAPFCPVIVMVTAPPAVDGDVGVLLDPPPPPHALAMTMAAAMHARRLFRMRPPPVDSAAGASTVPCGFARYLAFSAARAY
jgi:hypothetical protein